MSVSRDPSTGDAVAPQSGAAVRRGAAQVFDIGDGRVEAALRVAEQMSGRLLGWARDPDIYALVVRGTVDTTPAPARAAGRGARSIDAFAWHLECFSKPLATLLPASPSSAALALALAGTHRVAGDRFACAIDDVRAGAVPPGLVVHALSRLPEGIGAYLMLTGCIIGAADAHGLGLVTHCIADRHCDAIVSELADADPIDSVLDDRHEIKGASALEPLLDVIVRHFAAGAVDEIVASLAGETGEHRLWAATAAVQSAATPAVVATIALGVLARARALDIRETTILAARANAVLGEPTTARLDRAALIERLATPQASDLVLPTRAELQSLRRPA